MAYIELDTHEGPELVDLDDVSRIKHFEDDVADPWIELTMKTGGEKIKVEEDYENFIARFMKGVYYKKVIPSPLRTAIRMAEEKKFTEAAAKWCSRGDEEVPI